MVEVYCSLDELPARFPPCALTIGNFDGLHVGHQKILDVTLARARDLGCQAAVLIFDPHPTKVVAPERAPLLLSRPAERLRRFAARGLDAAVVLRFTAQVAALGPEEFVKRVVVEKLHGRAVIVGENFRYGHQQRGDFARLVELGRQHGFEAHAVPAVLVGGKSASSTRVRQLVRLGKVGQVRRLLGRPFSLEGSIVPGHGVGSKRTVPTLNLDPEAEQLPGGGVYVTETREMGSNRCWPSVTNVGSRPTFDGQDLSVETHLLSELSGKPPARIQLYFYRRLRDEKKFDSAERLREQILADASQAGRFFELLRTAGRKHVRVS